MRTIELTEERSAKVMSRLHKMADWYQGLLWDAVGEYEDECKTITEAWDRAIEDERVDSSDYDDAQSTVDTFKQCVNLIAELGVISWDTSETIIKTFESFLDYPVNDESPGKWLEELDSDIAFGLVKG